MFVPSDQQSRDEPGGADDEAPEEADAAAARTREQDPDAPGLGAVQGDEPEEIPEPNEPG
jgi:hypothetical protein